MEPITYQRIKRRRGRRSHGIGFRLNSKRFTVSKLRAKFLWLLNILNRWRRFYSRTLSSINKARRCRRSNASAADAAELPRSAAADRGECRLRSFRRSNSFYAEAIADCLDFIKRSASVSGDRPLSQPRVQFLDPSST